MELPIHLNISGVLETIYQVYGYDFRQYAEAHIERRIANRMVLSELKNYSEVIDKIKNDQNFAALLLQDLSIPVTQMFRDPLFYKSLRENVIPLLQTYPFIKIWHAGCSTGEEVYSMAIILQEEGLYKKTIIYATDFNQTVLNKAQEGIYPCSLMKDYAASYELSGGKKSFSDYYNSSYEYAIMNQSLKKNIVWANHNLVTDNVFAEVHMIFCRNVLIYFNPILQNKVQQLFYDSLVSGGVLCLGSKESLRFTEISELYNEYDAKRRIFKKKY